MGWSWRKLDVYVHDIFHHRRQWVQYTCRCNYFPPFVATKKQWWILLLFVIISLSRMKTTSESVNKFKSSFQLKCSLAGSLALSLQILHSFGQEPLLTRACDHVTQSRHFAVANFAEIKVFEIKLNEKDVAFVVQSFLPFLY